MSSIRAIAFLLITASLLSGCNQTTNVETERQRVIVQGSGEVRAAPDSFRVRATASARGDDVSALREQVDRQVDAVLALAERLDIDETQVSARELHVQPEWEHRPERQLLGYRAERPVEIRVDSMALFARLMTGLTEAGIRQIQPLGAEISNLAELEQQALALAVKDARSRARALAEAAQRGLGPALHIAEQGGRGPQPVMMMAESRAADSGEYRAGEQTITQRVEVHFELR